MEIYIYVVNIKDLSEKSSGENDSKWKQYLMIRNHQDIYLINLLGIWEKT